LSTRIPKELRDAVKAVARQKNLSEREYVTRTLTAAVEAELAASKPGFLEAFEKLLREHIKPA
jgi:hypothetical protein